MTPYCAAVCWLSSTLSFTISTSSRSEAISSRTGPTTRHGPHHGAQKSTSTGLSASRTFAWKSLSVTFARVAMSRFTIRTEVDGVPRGVGRRSLQRGRRPHGVRPDVDLDQRGPDQQRHGHRRGHGGGGEQLVEG